MIFASTGEAVLPSHPGSTAVVSRGPGAAISVEQAPNEVDIDLEANGVSQIGQIFGNIEDAKNPANWTNKITVQNGPTFLDGSVNPELTVGTLGNGGTLIHLSNVNGRIDIHHAQDGRAMSPVKDRNKHDKGDDDDTI